MTNSDLSRERDRLFQRGVLGAVALALITGAVAIGGAIREGIAKDPFWIVVLLGVFLSGLGVGYLLFRIGGRSPRLADRTGAAIRPWAVISGVLLGGALLQLLDMSVSGFSVYAVAGSFLSGASVAAAIEPTHRASMRKLADHQAAERAEVAEWVRRRRARSDEDPAR